MWTFKFIITVTVIPCKYLEMRRVCHGMKFVEKEDRGVRIMFRFVLVARNYFFGGVMSCLFLNSYIYAYGET